MKTSNYHNAQRARQHVEAGKHRDLIGGLWDEIGRLSCEFLVARGLRPDAYFLDVGCGCLRVGVHLIDYLEPGHYFGIDLSEDLLHAGYEVELPRYGLQHKLPRENLLCDGEFQFERLRAAPPFDMALAQSLFTHLPLNHIRLCMLRLAPVIRSGANFYVTLFHCRDDQEWAGPIVHERGGITTHPERDPYHYRSTDLHSVIRSLPWSVGEPEDWNQSEESSDRRLRETTSATGAG